MFVTITRPCPICGKPDWCSYYEHADGTETFHCFREPGLRCTDTVGIDGRSYVFKRLNDTKLGQCGVYEERSSYEASRAKWASEHGRSHGSGERAQQPVCKPAQRVERVYEDIVAPLSDAQLHERYSYFLSLLCLEDKHRRILESEWDTHVEALTATILRTWPIKSAPPPDNVRFKLTEKLNNPTRKAVMQKMIARFGDLKGVPYFYQRNTDGAWTFAALSGILYPVYNSKGQIIRLRCADDYPQIRLPDGSIYKFSYRSAEWIHLPDPKDITDFEIVESQAQNIHKVPMSSKGYPQGKVDGKYKNCSSYKEEVVKKNGREYVKNTYKNGCQAGGHPSLYAKPGDYMQAAYITEGEKKSIVTNAIFKVPVVCLPGVGTYSCICDDSKGESMLDALKRMGVKKVFLAFDADKYENKMVMAAEEGCARMLLEHGMQVYITSWNKAFGKGIDDIALAGSRPLNQRVEI